MPLRSAAGEALSARHDGLQARAVAGARSDLGAMGAAEPVADQHARRARNGKGEAFQHLQRLPDRVPRHALVR